MAEQEHSSVLVIVFGLFFTLNSSKITVDIFNKFTYNVIPYL